MKGIFMLFIYFIHAFQATNSTKSPVASVLYIFATMSGAAIYIFIAGFGVSYQDRSTPGTLAIRGIRMIGFQYLTNLLYVLSLLIPYPIVRNALSTEGEETFHIMLWIYLQFINIFFITGMIYLVMALLKKLRIPLIAYPFLAIVAAILAPLLYGIPLKLPVIGYVLSLLIGEAPFVSFTPLYFLSYALIGVAVGKLYRRIRDKRLFYQRLIVVCLAVIFVWWVTVALRIFGSSEEWGDVTDILSFEMIMDDAYSCPDIWHVTASLAHIGLFAGVLYFIEASLKKKRLDPESRGRIASEFLFISKNISKYYAIHLIVYLVAFGLHGYLGFDSRFCLLLMLISMIVTEVIVRIWLRIQNLVKKDGSVVL